MQTSIHWWNCILTRISPCPEGYNGSHWSLLVTPCCGWINSHRFHWQCPSSTEEPKRLWSLTLKSMIVGLLETLYWNVSFLEKQDSEYHKEKPCIDRIWIEFFTIQVTASSWHIWSCALDSCLSGRAQTGHLCHSCLLHANCVPLQGISRHGHRHPL